MKAKHKIAFFVPTSSLETCKDAVFAAGAGRYPDYSECCWTTFGTGQFRPINYANPHIGNVGELTEVEEARVEILCVGEQVARKAVLALTEAHPYEEPAYEVYNIEPF